MTRLQIEIALGVLFIILSSVALVAFGLQEESRMVLNDEEVQAETIEQGAALFATNCEGCHGPQGKGLEGVGPALNDPHFFLNRMDEVGWTGSFEDYIVSTISAGRLVSTRPQYVGGGRPAMPAWSEEFGGPLREDQINTLATFILNWEASALGEVEVDVVGTPTPVADDPVTRGQIVYAEMGCGACHAIAGVSDGTVGPELTNIGSRAEARVEGMTAEEYLRESILDPNAHMVDGFDPGIMPQNFGERMESMELDDLVAFLLSLQ